MTSFNREKYIGEAIESVLSSTFKEFELIIVDDCSADRTVEIARKYASQDSRIRVYVNKNNIGDYPNRNRAASFAKGEYLKYLDSDDTLFTYTLERMVSYMTIDKTIGLGLVVRDHCSESNVGKIWNTSLSYKKQFFQDGFLENGPTGAIILKAAFDKVGGFSGKRMIGDVELWLKIALHYKVVELPKFLVFHRVHASQESKSGFEFYLIDQLKMFSEIFAEKDCPLSFLEKKQIIKKRKNINTWVLFRYFAKSGDIKRFINLFVKLIKV
jgi:glycosyltransferase involved in cell wall biosynthesis